MHITVTLIMERGDSEKLSNLFSVDYLRQNINVILVLRWMDSGFPKGGLLDVIIL